MKVLASKTIPPGTVQGLLDLLERSGGGVQVIDPPEAVRAAWRRLLHVLRSGGHVPRGWHLVQRGRNSGDLVVQLRPGVHPSKRYQPAQRQDAVDIPHDLADAHPAVSKLRDQPQRLPASDANRSRALLLLQAIAKQAAAKGYTVQAGAQSTLLAVAPELVSIGIRAWEESGKRWNLRLALAVDGPGRESATWTDNSAQPLETQLPEIIDLIFQILTDEAARRQAQAEAKRARLQRERDQQITDHRAGILRDQVSRWLLAHHIRCHCNELVAAGMSATDPWLTWARAYADNVDPLAEPPGLPTDPQPGPGAQKSATIARSSSQQSSYVDVQPWHPNRRWYSR